MSRGRDGLGPKCPVTVVFDLHVVNDLDLHSVENIKNDIFRGYNFGSYNNYLIIHVLLHSNCFQR